MEEVKEFHEVENEEGLFDDLVDEDQSMPTEGASTEESKNDDTSTVENDAKETAPVATEDTHQENAPFLEVKYDKESRALTKEEAKDLAEKGLNYDRLRQKLETERAKIDRLAKMNGMDYDAFINSLNETQFKYEVDKEISNLKTANPDAPEDLLKELAERRVNEKIGNFDRNAVDQQKMQDDATQKQLDRDIEILKRDFPDVDVAHLPNEVLDYVKQGNTLPYAYMKYQREQDIKNRPVQEAEAKVAKQNEENKKKSIGSTTNAGDQEKDDFLEGFNSI